MSAGICNCDSCIRALNERLGLPRKRINTPPGVPAVAAPGYGADIDRVIDSDEAAGFDTSQWLRLAIAAADQAGVSVRDQARIAEMLARSPYDAEMARHAAQTRCTKMRRHAGECRHYTDDPQTAMDCGKPTDRLHKREEPDHV